MDSRFSPVSLDTTRDVRVILHPSASIEEVSQGTATDGVDLSGYVTEGSYHTQFDCSVTLKWNRELFGSGQPRPKMILEIQIQQGVEFIPIWIGIIGAVRSYTISRGERSMQLVAQTREQHTTWKKTTRSTQLFPMLTDIGYIITQIGLAVGMILEDILIPATAFTTTHTNTQLADMNAWDMLVNLMVPMGWAPWIDGRGRLRAADKTLEGREPDILLTDERVLKANGSVSKTEITRVRLMWRDPILKKSLQNGRKLADVVMTMGWFLPFLRKEVHYSEDKTQRATGTYLVVKNSVNNLVPFCTERWEEQGENRGRIQLVNYAFAPTIISFVASWNAAHEVPDIAPVGGGPTIPTGRRVEAFFQLAFTLLLLNIGTGVYEIWGSPFEWVHARNTTEVFNDSIPVWVDNPKEIECDFIRDEEHAQSVAAKELIYETRSTHKWSLTIVDDPRIEHSDVVQLPDLNKFYIEDFKRNIFRGGDSGLELTGFIF